MTRNLRSAKAAGTKSETVVVRYLAHHLSDDRIERRRLSGARDRGDVAGVRIHGQRLVLEVKDTSKLMVGPWLKETEIERGNDDALAGVCVAKRVGLGQPEDMVVFMTLKDFTAILAGFRPECGGDNDAA